MFFLSLRKRHSNFELGARTRQTKSGRLNSVRMWAEKHFRKDDVSYIAVLLTEAHNNGNIRLYRSWWQLLFPIGSLNIMLHAESLPQ